MRKIFLFLILILIENSVFAGNDDKFYEENAKDLGLTKEQGHRMDQLFSQYDQWAAAYFIDGTIIMNQAKDSRGTKNASMMVYTEEAALHINAERDPWDTINFDEYVLISIEAQPSKPENSNGFCTISLSINSSDFEAVDFQIGENPNTGEWVFAVSCDEIFGIWSAKKISYKIPLQDGSFYEGSSIVEGISEVRSELSKILYEFLQPQK